MRIMCLNAWGGKLRDELSAFLRENPPDVLCLQEVVHTPATGKHTLTYRDGDHVLPQSANLFREVRECLPGHVAAFCPAAQGVLWDGDVEVPSQWGLATFVHESWPVVGQVQGFVHKDYSAKGYGAHPRSRGAHGVRVHDRRMDRFVAILHMHGLRDLNGKLDTPERAAQADRFLAFARQLARPGDLVVLCGDFNVEPGSATLDLLKREGFTELVTARGFDGTRTSHYSKPGRFADYLLVNDAGVIRGFDVIRSPEVSDHCPLVLTI